MIQDLLDKAKCSTRVIFAWRHSEVSCGLWLSMKNKVPKLSCEIQKRPSAVCKSTDRQDKDLSCTMRFDNLVCDREDSAWLQVHLYSTQAPERGRETLWNEEDGLIQPGKSGEVELGKAQQSAHEPVLVQAVIPAGSHQQVSTS